MHCRCRPAHCAALAGSVEMLRALRSERGNLWLASHVTGNYPLHEAAVARRIGRYERIRYFACLSDLSFICAQRVGSRPLSTLQYWCWRRQLWFLRRR